MLPFDMIPKKAFSLVTLATVTALSAIALAGEYKAGSIVVEHPWARVTLQDRPAGGYLTIHNMGAEEDTLLGATSELSERTELHAHTMQDGIMRMRRVQKIELPPGSDTKLKPGGFHLMMFGLKEPVAGGGKIPVVLRFEKAGNLAIELTVRNKADEHGHKHGSSSE